MTPSQISGVTNAGYAISKLSGLTAQLVNDVNASMGLAWNGDADHEAAFFDALGDTAALAWQKNGVLINAALALGASYADLRKPDTVCIVCADGHVVPSGVAFPVTPLAIWNVPVATKADALALIAAEAATPGTILAALVAAQPSA